MKPGKEFKDFSCFCPLKCSKTVTVESRRNGFNTINSSESWEIQSMLLAGHVKLHEVHRHMRYAQGDPSKLRRQSSRWYYPKTDGRKEQVCDNLFLWTLCIDSPTVQEFTGH